MSERPRFEWRLGSRHRQDVFAGDEPVERHDIVYEPLGTDERGARFVFEEKRARLLTAPQASMMEVWLEARPVSGEWVVIESSVEES